MERVQEARSRRITAAQIETSESDTGGEAMASRISWRQQCDSQRNLPETSISRKADRRPSTLYVRSQDCGTDSPSRNLGPSMTKPPASDDHAETQVGSGSSSRTPRGEAERGVRAWDRQVWPEHTRPLEQGRDTVPRGNPDRERWQATASPEGGGTSVGMSESRASIGTSGRRRKRMWAGSEDEDDNASPTLPNVQITPAIREHRDHRTFGNAYAPYSKPAEKAEALPAKSKERGADTEVASSVAESSIGTSRRDEAGTSRIGARRLARAREKKGKLLNEQERKEMLEADKWAKNVQPHSVDCVACNRTFALDTRGRYRATNWYKHRQICGEISRLDRERDSKDDAL
ncbi:hypothetical protein BDN71DRAFT_1590786 [Pleurotus eryngii]|uniref:Uncharacterized protein n=1 Tax=Pleurotus eryngii TaxID=5323 RepID=A0A9P5ZT66_PLEER|nr:hypothetical protein BDN71DRAFT_1590786 [Pleurotus eryngii]